MDSFRYLQYLQCLLSYFSDDRNTFTLCFPFYSFAYEKELQKIAVQEIYNLYGIDIAKDPNYRYACKFFPATSSQREYYFIGYCRYINGYATNEGISILIDTTGQITSISQNLGLFDEVAETITAKKLEATKDNFFDSISDPTAVQENMYIELDNFGKCSMVFKVKDYVQIRTIYVEIS